jgi:hypothetical protein
LFWDEIYKTFERDEMQQKASAHGSIKASLVLVPGPDLWNWIINGIINWIINWIIGSFHLLN